MNSASRKRWRDYFALDHLDPGTRPMARALMGAYAVGCIGACYSFVYNVFVLGIEGREFKLFSQAVVVAILLGMIHVVHRGHSLLSVWITAVFTLLIVLQRTWLVGELNAISCTLTLPIVAFSFMHARRSILTYSSMSYVVLVSFSWWIDASRPAQVSSHHPSSTALISLTILMLMVNLVTWVIMHIEQMWIAHISRSTLEVKQARQEALEQSVEAERARQEIMLTQRARARYLANTSHELRTPLSTIISYAELLDESLEELDEAPEHVRRDVGLIKSSGEHLLRRINDILDLSRLEVGKMPRHDEAVRLGDIFTQADRFASERASTDNGAKLRVTWPQDAAHTEIEVLCDDLLVTKLIANLLLHLKQDGPISVFVVPRDGQVDIVFKLKFWTIPPDTRQLARLEPGHLHLLLYRALLETLQLPFEEPGETSTGPWRITLNAPREQVAPRS